MGKSVEVRLGAEDVEGMGIPSKAARPREEAESVCGGGVRCERELARAFLKNEPKWGRRFQVAQEGSFVYGVHILLIFSPFDWCTGRRKAWARENRFDSSLCRARVGGWQVDWKWW
jgi:hypothetical protein